MDEPTKPRCSASDAKAKSVAGSGRESSRVWLPSSRPARGGKDPDRAKDREPRDEEERDELSPANAGEEEDGEERRRVDERGAEVRLGEHEQGRTSSQA